MEVTECFNMRVPFSFLLLILLEGTIFGQESQRTKVLGELDILERVEEVKEYEGELRELRILAPTLTTEEIDRAVLNRLMQEIIDDPQTTQDRLGVSAEKIDDIFVTISNAKSFINNDEFANVRAMCKAWNNSELNGDQRIKEAIEAYKTRDQFTKSFVAKYYRLVLFDIESLLHPSEKIKFDDYMDDRRRRMASSGARSWGSVVENVKSGRDAISFHCRKDRDK